MEKLEHTPMSDNELIAEFMGLRRHHKETHLFWIPINDSWNSKEHLEYHREWDWLMPVVEKIEEIEGIRFIIEKNRVLITGIEYFWNSGTTSETKLTTTYNAVIEFIKWLNSEKLKHKQP